MNNIDPIQEELAQAGEASPITPSLLQLDSCRIMTDTEVPEEEFLFRMYGKPCFPRRDISTVTGMEKCGKSATRAIPASPGSGICACFSMRPWGLWQRWHQKG